MIIQIYTHFKQKIIIIIKIVVMKTFSYQTLIMDIITEVMLSLKHLM
jgi:hypothetical protein